MKNLAYIIEDNNDISHFFSRALATVGYQTEVISNGKVAILRLEKESPSLVILDMHIPEVDGGDILTYIRAKEHLKETKVIIATADARLGEFHNNRADLLLQKPVSFSQIRDFAERFKTGKF